MALLYPLIVFLQPGILWPALAPYRPQLVLSIVALIVAITSRDARDQAAAKLSHPIFLWLCVFVVVQAISVYYSGVLAMLNEFDFWSTYAIFVAVSLLLITNKEQMYRFLVGTLIGSAVVIGYGLWAVATHSPRLAGNRAGSYGMYENHNDYTFLILMCLPYACALIGIAKSRMCRLALLAFAGACIAGVLLSLSRGGILALVFMVLLLYWRSTSGARRVAGVVILTIIGSLAIVYQFAAREENQKGHYTLEDSEDSRYELWRAARAVIVAHPILGVGSGRFPEHAREYAELSHNNIGKVTHNSYLEVATGSGLVGFTAFIMMLGGIVKVSAEKRGAEGSAIPPRIRTATHVCILTIMLRALLDAKAHDWSFYFLAVLAISIATVREAGHAAHHVEAPAEDKRLPAAPRRPTLRQRPGMTLTSGRPSIYGRRS